MLVRLEKSKVMSGVIYSMSKATIWDLRMRRCLIRNRRPSWGVRWGSGGMSVEARIRDAVVV